MLLITLKIFIYFIILQIIYWLSAYIKFKGANMWEITLIGKKLDILYFQDLIERLKLRYEDMYSAITYSKELILSIAINNDECIDEIEDMVYETILKISKGEVFDKNLKIFGSDKSFNSFMLSTLILMDLKEEIEYAKIHTKLSPKVNIRSFTYFRLHKMVKLWGKVIDYINIQFSNSFHDEMYLEFLKFLATNSSTQIDLIYLEEHKDKMYLLDKNRNTISIVPKADEIGMIVNVIVYSPRKLIISGIDNLSSRVTNLLSYIFEDRLSLLI